MADLRVIAKSKNFRRYAAATCWVAIVATLTAVSISRNATKPYVNCYQSKALDAFGPENEIKGFTCYRYDPDTNKLSFAASVGSLRAENARLGIFKTAAARAIRIKDLQLQFRRDSQSSAASRIPRPGPGGAALADEQAGQSKGLEDMLIRLSDARDYWGVNIDLSNTREVTIDNFDCQIFDDGAVRLGVQSKRAVVDSHWPEVTLRGHVTISTGDGSSLVSNYIKWDTKGERFTAEGTYFLRRGDSQIEGRGIYVDSNLNILNTKTAMK